MRPNRDLPSTWIKFRQSNCETCIAACCMMPVEVTAPDLVRLGYIDAGEASLKKAGARLVARGIVKSFRASTGLFMLSQQFDGACVFLDPKSRRCTVYANRPDMCRKFPTEMGTRLGFCPYTEIKPPART